VKTVLGYSPYQQAGMPKGPLLIATLAVIVALCEQCGPAHLPRTGF